MPSVDDVCRFLEQFAPDQLAESWDNVGLLIGDRRRPVRQMMTCLTVTPESAGEAVRDRADLIVAHHPLPFHATKRVTADTPTGQLLLLLVEHQIAVYSPHTAFDSCERGINQRLAEGLGLIQIQPLVPRDDTDPLVGTGRRGLLPEPLSVSQLGQRTGQLLSVAGLFVIGDTSREVARVAVACGSAGQLLAAAHDAGCNAMIMGEASFHTCLEARARNVALVLPGHFASERFAVQQLAAELAEVFPDIRVWASCEESDPLHWVSTDTH